MDPVRTMHASWEGYFSKECAASLVAARLLITTPLTHIFS
jgi:hypothetical protein